MKNLLLALALSVAAVAQAHAQDTAPMPPVMMIENGALVGDGADLLNAKLENTQFILIGEEHGFADAPVISKALATSAWRYGLRHHVVEAGPIATEWAVDALRSDGVDGLGAALDGRPLALPFLNMREDAELAQYFLDNRGKLWGIDQEFIGSSVLHLERLEELARNDDARTMAGGLLEAERTAFSTGAQDRMFLFAANDETFSGLETAFANQPEALSIVTALRESASIYQAYASGRNFKSNTDRIELMKAQFMEHYHGSRKRAPRALFKMGAIHLGRGTTFLNTFDIGSLTEGVAASNDMEVMRLLINPLEGEQTQIRPSPDGFFTTIAYESEDVAGVLGMVGIDTDDIPIDGWALIDLAPLRFQLGQKGLNALPNEARFMILGYDYLVTTRGAKAATPLAN